MRCVEWRFEEKKIMNNLPHMPIVKNNSKNNITKQTKENSTNKNLNKIQMAHCFYL